MSISRIALCALLLPALAACGSPGTSVGLGDGAGGSGGSGDTYSAISDLRGPENEDLSADSSIQRLHDADTEPTGDDFYLPSETPVTVLDNGDTLVIRGMPFDGNDRYARLNTAANPTGVAGANGTFFIYRNEQSTVTDPVGGSGIGQYDYLAIHQERAGASVYVTIVGATRSSDTIPMEGFVYGRTGGVDMATANQGTWSGDYAAIRTFNNDVMLEYVNGLMSLDIDFEELNSAGAIRFRVTNRAAYDMDGNFLGNLGSFGAIAENGALDAQGEFQADGSLGTVNAVQWNPDTGEFETAGTLSGGQATITGILAGTNAATAVGALSVRGGDYVFNNPIWIDTNGDGIIQGRIFSGSVTTGAEGLRDVNDVAVGAGTNIDDNFPTAENEIFYVGDPSLNGTVNETGGFILDRN